MVENVLAYDDTSVEIRSREATVASPAAVELTQFPWPLLCSEDAALWVQNLTGFILKRQEQELNLDFDAEHRGYFFGVAKSLKAFEDEIRKQISPEIGYESGQLRIGASVPAWEQRFEQFKQLPENWDSYGASHISDEAIEKGKSILTLMTAAGFSKQPFVAPSPSGGIQIEWYVPGREVVLEIPPTGDPITYSLVETTVSGQECEIEETIPKTEGLAQLLQRIIL